MRIAHCTCLIFFCFLFVCACDRRASYQSAAPNVSALCSVTNQHASAYPPLVFVNVPGTAQSVAVFSTIHSNTAIQILALPLPIPVFQMPAHTVPKLPVLASPTSQSSIFQSDTIGGATLASVPGSAEYTQSGLPLGEPQDDPENDNPHRRIATRKSNYNPKTCS